MPEEKVGVGEKIRVKLYKGGKRKRVEKIRNVLIILSILTFLVILLFSMLT